MVSRPQQPPGVPASSRSQSVSKVPTTRAEWDAALLGGNSKASSSLRMVTFAPGDRASSSGGSGGIERDRHYRPRSQSSSRPPHNASSVVPPPPLRHVDHNHQSAQPQPPPPPRSPQGLLSPISHTDAMQVRSFSTGRAAVSSSSSEELRHRSHQHQRRPASEVGISNYDDPDEVARAILDLRHKRELQQQQRSSSRQQRRSAEKAHHHQPTQSQQQSQQPSSLSQQPQHQPSSNHLRTSQQLPMATGAGSPPQPPGRSSSRSRPVPPPPPHQVATTTATTTTTTSQHNNSLTYQEPLRRTTSLQSGNSSSQENHNPLGTTKAAPPQATPSAPSPAPGVPSRSVVKPLAPPGGGLEYSDKATVSIRQAEERIDGLLQELEDLRFFQEIDQTHSSAVAGPQKTLGAIRGRSSSDAADNSPSPPQHLLKTPKGDTIPTIIRAPSPLPPGQRLPPPPNHLSPRKISRMDRTSLELETQTLVRQVQVLTRDHQDAAAELRHVRESVQKDHAAQGHKVRQLETHLHQLAQQLQSAKADMEATRAALERQVCEGQEATQLAQHNADALRLERDQLQADLESKQREFKAAKTRWKDDLRREIEQLAAREAVLELQLGEATEELQTCQQTVEQQRREMDQLQQEAAEQAHSSAQAYEVRLTSLQEELSLAQDKLKKAIGENTTKSKKVKDYSEQLESAKKQSDEQLHLISDMTERLDSIHAEYRDKFQELKQVYEAKEKRRLDEMVESHSSQNKEHERRLLALQEQLKHANDRHYEELRQQKAEHDKQLLAQVDLLADQHKESLSRVQQELEAVRAQYDQTILEKSQLNDKLQHETERPKAEIEQKDQEISRLTTKAESLAQLVAEKDEQIKDLTNRLSEQETRHITRMSQVEALHAEALMSRDESIAVQRREFRILEVQLRNELSGRETDLAATKAELDSRVTELQLELKRANSSLTDAQASLDKNRDLGDVVVDLRASLARVQTDLATERTAHESCVSEMRVEIAKLEGKLRAGESSLKQKRDLIDDLEDKLRSMTLADKENLEFTQKELHRVQQELQRNQAETIQRHRLEVADWEVKVQNREDSLKETLTAISKLEQTVRELEQVKTEANMQLQQLQAELDSQNVKVNEYERLLHERSSIESQLEMKEKHAKDVSEQFNSALKQLQDDLEAERKSKESLMIKLRELEGDMELKEHQSRRLPVLHDQLKDLIAGREKLQEQLGKVEAELERKDKQLKQVSARYTAENREFLGRIDEMKKSKESLESQLHLLEQELQSKSERTERVSRQASDLIHELAEKSRLTESVKAQLSSVEQENQKLKARLEEISGTSDFSVELQSKIEQLTKAKASLEAKILDLEEDREEREKQVRQSSERYSNQIVDLQMQVEELSRSKTSLMARLAQTESELERKDELLSVTSSQHSGDLNVLHTKLADQLEQKGKLEARLRAAEARLADKDRSTQQMAEQKFMELQSKNEAGAKECRTLRLKIGDVEAELERKEKQIKDVVNRYSQEIADLKDKLDEESRTTSALRREAEQLRGDASTVSSNLSYEANAIKDRLGAMEKSLEVERALARDSDNARIRLEEELAAAEKSKQELEARFEKINGERTEVITALEEVIHEVQSREEEIESLANILRKRDEELEHAKLIATKALASAQDLRTRYKERGSERNLELNDKVTELNKNLEFVTTKNDELQRRTSRLEEQLRAREAECSNLKSRINNQDSLSRRPPRIDRFISLSNSKPPQGDSPTGSDDFESLSDGASADYNDTGSADMASSPGWLHAFDSGSTDSGDNGSSSGIKTEPADLSRRSIERDALRKYVRKRYLKSKGSC